MTQFHPVQQGLFHVTTNAKNRETWCTYAGIPEILIDNLFMTRTLYGACVYGFCVLPDHMHMIVNPGERGLSRFMQSFKTNSMRTIHRAFQFRSGEPGLSAATNNGICWQKGFHDRLIHDTAQFHNAMAYVHGNPVRDGLIDDPQDWPWSSLQYLSHIDYRQIL